MMARLGDICNIQSGGTPSRSNPSYWQNGTIPWVKISDIKTKNIFGTEERITEEGLSNSSAKLFQKGTILYTIFATLGEVGILDIDAATNQAIAGLNITDSSIVNRDYLFYFLTSLHDYVNDAGRGVAQNNINLSILRSIEVPLPDLPTQRHIAAVLDKVTGQIDLCWKQLADLDLLVKSRFVETFGDPVKNTMGYPVHQLSDYILFLTSGSRGWAKYYSDEGEWFITIKNVKDCRITVDDVQCINPPKNAEAERTRLQEGDLLISITADLGRTGVVTKEIAEHGAYNNQHLTSIRLNRDVLNPLYVAYYMESEAGKRQFEAKNMSAVKAGLNFDSIRTLQLIVPPLDKQQEFVNFVAQTDKSKFAVQQMLNNLETLKKSLMQEYFG